MHSRLLGLMAALLAGAGWASAEAPSPAPSQAPAGAPAAFTGAAVGSGPIVAPAPPAPAPLAAPALAAAPAPTTGWGPYDAEPSVWASAEYLLWRLSGGTPPDVQHLLLTGVGSDLSPDRYHSGIRASAGFRLGCDWADSVEVTGFYLQRLKGNFQATESIDPFTNRALIPDAIVVRLPLDPAGDLDAADRLTSTFTGSSSRQIWGVEANVRSPRWFIGPVSFDFLAGVRNINLDESLVVNGVYVFAEPLSDPDEVPGNPENGRIHSMRTFDSVSTHNRFFGGQVGTSVGFYFGDLSLNAQAKVAVGGTFQRVRVVGSTIQDEADIEPSAGAPTYHRPETLLPGGLFTPANFSQSRRRVSVVPDVSANLAYQFTGNIRGWVGYDFLYMNGVARTTDVQFAAPNVGGSQVRMHGLTFGLQVGF